jgi:hypothetical protein
LVLFPLMNIGSTTAVGVGIVGMLGLVGLAYGPLGAYLPSCSRPVTATPAQA